MNLIAQSIMLLGIGLPSLAMGAYYWKTAKATREEIAKAKEKKKGKQDKKSKRGKKSKGKQEKDKDQKGKERGTSGGASLILFGLIFTAYGVTQLVRALIGE